MKALQKLSDRYGEAVIRAQAWLNGLICILSACALDNEGYIAHIVCAVTLVWLFLYALSHKVFEDWR